MASLCDAPEKKALETLLLMQICCAKRIKQFT
jgi:hypothetical protein